MFRMLLFTSALAFGQVRSFEVAAIKPPNPSSLYPRVLFQPGGRLVADNASLRILIEDAYGLLPFQLSGGPKWLDSQRFSILATAKAATTNEEMRKMLQTLLAQRFGLVMHTESKEMSTYALMVKDPAKVKVKLAPSTPGGKPVYDISFSGRGAETNHIVLRGQSMTTYAKVLSRQLERPVMDETGLIGAFDFEFDATREENEINPFVVPYAPSLGDLGLRIDSRKGPVQIYVIDQAGLPSEN